jgi:dephospho-CoA kinase
MYSILLIFIIILAIAISFSMGDGELKLNKTTYKSVHKILSSANFKNFMDKSKFIGRLICITGADYSGRTHLANLIAKKHNYTVISAKDKTPQEIRKIFKITPKSSADLEKRKKEKFIIEGKLSDEQMRVIFKGKNYNRNFLLLFVQPKPDVALKWSKRTKQPKSDFAALLKESDALLKQHKKYTVYVVKNDFKN